MKRLHTSLLAAAALTATPLLAQGSLQEDVDRHYGLHWSDIQQVDVRGFADVTVTATITIDGQEDLLVLTPHSVRAEGFQVLNQAEDGSLFGVAPEANRNLRGSIVGQPDSQVAGALLDDGLYAFLQLADGRELWLEPLAATFPEADFGSYVLYDGTAVEVTGHSCGSELLAMNHAKPTTGSGTFAMGGPDIAELAYDADFEYFQDYGSSGATQSRIELITNTFNQQYETEVNLTHEITTIIVRTSSNDPYTSSDASTLLNQFRNHWNSSQGGIQRDVAHLMTGRSIQGGTIGIAWLGVICNGSFGYGLSESDFNGNFSSATDLTAHELGHNWNADHCSCTNFTMNPFITSSNTFSPTFTRPDIISFANGLNCLDAGTGTPPGKATNPSPSNGANGVDNNADLDWNNATGATSYNVYFGTNPNPGLVSAGQSASNLSLGTLNYSTTYFWRVDSVNSDGTTTGDSWSFTVEADPGGGNPTTLLDSGFESGSFVGDGWTPNNNKPRVLSQAARTGSFGARIRRTSNIRQSVSTVGFSSVTLKYSRRTRGMDSGENLFVEWFNGSSWVNVETTSSTSWSDQTVALPSGAGNNPNFAVRFRTNANKNAERGDVDNIEVIGS